MLAQDSRPGTRGVGYHRLGCDPYRVTGGELWSSSYGKVCPGDARIAQLPGLIDRARRIVDGQEEDPMAEYADQLDRIEQLLVDMPKEIERRQRAVETQLNGGTRTRVVDLLSKVDAMPGVVGAEQQEIVGELRGIAQEIEAAVATLRGSTAPAGSAA